MKCPKCNFENPDGQKFCGECGALLGAHFAKEEFRLLTIIFADLSGFTKLSHNLDPEDVRDLVNICFEYLNLPIVENGGIIHKYEGDLVLALFGLPSAHEDDTERAIKAGLEMMQVIPEINNAISLRLKIKSEIGLHIGINKGTVVVGEVGSKEKKEYTIMGDAVNIASRLKDTAKNGEILVSEPVFRSTRYLFEYEALPPVSIKGIEGEVKLFKPLRIKEKPDPKRGIKGIYSPMVGRDNELELLKSWVGKLNKGRFGVSFILGDAGLGKSRLFEELKSFIKNNQLPITILESRCFSYSDAIPYFSFIQIIKKIFEIEDNDSEEIVYEKLHRKTKTLFPDEYKDILPYLEYLFSISISSELAERLKYLKPQDLKIQIFLSVKKLLSQISLHQPVFITIDDFHLIDSSSLELIEFIFDSPDVFPFFLLTLSRIEKEKNYYKTKEILKNKLGKDYLEIILKPLDKDTSTKLADNLLKMSKFNQGFLNQILSKAEGNPFFLEEIIRSMIDEKILIFESGNWHLSYNLSSFSIPDTVQAVIAARLDRLGEEEKTVLEMASVIGRNFYVRILENISKFNEMMLILHLATLEELEYITKLRIEPELEYIFRHPLLQEVVYNSLLKKRRKELHRRTGEAIENIFHNRLDDFSEILAYQYSNSDNLEKAIEWLKKAGKRARDRYANDEAISYFEKVITIIRENDLIPQYKDTLIETYDALGDIYTLKGEYEKSIKNYEKMFSNTDDIIIQVRSKRKIASVYEKQLRLDDSLNILESGLKILNGDSSDYIIERSEIYILRCWILRIKGEMEEAIEEAMKGLSMIEIPEIDREKVKNIKARGFNNLGVIFYDKGEYDKAIEFFQKYLRMSEEIDDKQGISRASNNLGLVYHGKGEYDKAIELYGKCLRISKEIGDKEGIDIASDNLGTLYYAKGEYDKAIELFRKRLRNSEEIGDKKGIGISSGNLGLVYLGKSEYDIAIEFLRKDLQIAEEIGDKQGIGISNLSLGRAYLEIGKLKESEEYLLKSKIIFEEISDKYYLIDTYCSYSELLLKKGEDLEKAILMVNKALKLAEEMDSKDRKAVCYFTYGKIYSNSKDMIYNKKAEEYFKKAMEIYKELKDKKSLADCYLEYAKSLKNLQVQNFEPIKKAVNHYLQKALEIYKELKLTNKIKEIEMYIDKIE